MNAIRLHPLLLTVLLGLATACATSNPPALDDPASSGQGSSGSGSSSSGSSGSGSSNSGSSGSGSSGTLLVANKGEASLSFIHIDSGEVVATLPTGVGPHEVGVSPDGTRALITNYGVRGEPGSSLTLVDVPRAEVIKTLDLGQYTRPHGVVWLDERRAVVTCEDYHALLKIDVETGEVLASIDTDQEVSHMVALGEDDRAFLANIGSGSMTVIDLAEKKRVANVATGAGAEGVAVAAGGSQVWVTNRADDTVKVYDASTLEELKSFASEGFPIRATATPDGRILVTRARAGDMVIYDVETLSEKQVVAFDLEAAGFEGRLFGDRFGDSSVPIGVIVDGDGSHAFVAHANADVITEVDLEKGEISRLLKAGREPDGMGYSPHAVTRATSDRSGSR